MKKHSTKPIVQTVRNRLNPEDIYYTWNIWEPRSIDGVLFLPVVKKYPSNQTQQIHYVKKDNMEFIK
jgi:hypothetical protein